MELPFNKLYAALLLIPAIGYLAFRQTPTVHSQTLPPAVEGQQFRIILGLKDTESKQWKGKIAVSGGDILSLEGWRAAPADRAAATGDFQFTAKIAQLENQLRPGAEYGQTGYEGAANARQVPQGLLLKLKGSNAARVQFQADSGTFEFQTDQIAYGARVPFLNGNATVERLPMEQKLSTEGPADDHPAIAIAPDGKRWIAWLSYSNKSDSVKISDGTQVYTVGEPGDLHAPAIASDGKGAILAVWPRNQNGAFQLHGATFRNGAWSKEEALTSAGSSNAWPQLASDNNGHAALIWQGFRGTQSSIFARTWDGRRWTPEQRISDGAGDCWAPAASYGGGRLWLAWDSYNTGAYQIYAREWNKPITRITKGDLFSVRPSIVVNQSGQPVVAWEESDPLWGKDFAYQVDRRGTVEYKNRRVRVAYLDSGEWKEHPARVGDAVPPEIRRYIQQPQLAFDSTGHLYMTLRSRTAVRTARIDYWAANGRWETFLTHLDRDRWAPVILMPASIGRNGMRSAIALDRGQVYAAWATDNRAWIGNANQDLDIYTTTLPVTGNAAQLSGGQPITTGTAAANPNPGEADDLRRIRAYRYAVNGKQYRILRGDFHRHTELSSDGAGDGMLEDNYRYTLDAAAMDIGYVSDHQMGQNDEYNWWITQKSNDLYYLPQRFVPMYGYERSVPYPNGHRNVIWAERGKPVLRISPSENQGQTNTGSVLYPYLKETQGIATSHTSATDQGTDWRDNDPALEPVVEIYQGYDNNYEEPNAPRTWKAGKTQSHGKEQPAGYVWNAWAKGYKLGVQSSSDHISTHTSYACVLAENFTRQGILDAIRKRHTYAATDNIVMDFQIPNTAAGAAMMGDIADASTPPRLNVRINGTAPIKQIDVIKNNKYIHQLRPGQKDARFEYVDNAITSGESYYYVRVEQTDGQLAWSSPIWIRYK
jgi:hypothetical protein